MKYFKHLKKNWKVGFKLALLSFFHFLHGIIRTEKTSHKYWGISSSVDIKNLKRYEFERIMKDQSRYYVLNEKEDGSLVKWSDINIGG